LLRTLAAALDRSREATPEAAFDPTLRRLALALERDRRSLRDAITHLSASAGMVATAARILSERSADIAQHPADVQALVELKSAVEQLTVTIVRLPAMAPQARASLSEPPLPNSDPPHNLPVHDLGREVRELLKEFE